MALPDSGDPCGAVKGHTHAVPYGVHSGTCVCVHTAICDHAGFSGEGGHKLWGYRGGRK